jgi:drug/metabolite transporter (DMT)-like permease
MKNNAYIAFGLLGLIWGCNFIFMKWAFQLIEPTQVVFLRILLGFLPILGFALWRKELKLAHLRHWFHFLVMSLLATTLYYYAFARGTSLLPSGGAGMLSGAIPLFAFITAFIVLRQDRLTLCKAMGILLGFAGVLLIARPWTMGASEVNAVGVLYIVAGSLSLGCSFVYARKFLSRLNISPVALSTYQIGFALISKYRLGAAFDKTDREFFMHVRRKTVRTIFRSQELGVGKGRFSPHLDPVLYCDRRC